MTWFGNRSPDRSVLGAEGVLLALDGDAGIDLLPGGRRRTGIRKSLLMTVIGVVVVFVGVMIHRQHEPYANGISTTATVTGIHTTQDRKGQWAYSRVISFDTSTGRSVTIVDPEATSRRPNVGGKLKVSYLRDDPESARIIPSWDWASLAMMAAGGLVAVIGVVIFLIRLSQIVFGIYFLSRRIL